MLTQESCLKSTEEKILESPKSMFEIKHANDDGLFLEAALYGKQVDILLDTGATISVLSSRVYLELPERKRPDLGRDCGQLRLADGKIIMPMGIAVFPLEVSGRMVGCRMLVADIEVPAVIGYDFMRQNSCIMDVGKGTVTLNGVQAKCYLESQKLKSVFRLSLLENVMIPACSEMIIPTKIVGDIPVGHQAIVDEGSTKLAKVGVLVGKSLFDPSSEVIPVRVANVTNLPQRIYKRTVTAECMMVRSCHVKDDAQSQSIGMNQESLRQMDEAHTVPDDSVPEYLQVTVETSSQHLDNDKVKQLKELLNVNKHVFAKDKDDLGKTNLVYHKIDTGNAKPVKQAPRRLPLTRKEVAEQEVKRMLKAGVITPSKSPWASPIVLVKKADSSVRFCIDYRKLNELTIKDSYPLPRIDDSLDTLRGSKWFSVIDMQSGYWQVEVDPADREKTAFVTSSGLYEFKSMPFGLCNAGASFQRLLESVLSSCQWRTCLIYIDDIIIFSETFEEHQQRLQEVLSKISEAGLKISPKKCKLFQKKVKFLGHVVSEEGVSPDPEKIEAVKSWSTPTTVKELRSFLGLASYYRKFIKGFATIARPLNKLTEKDSLFKWSKECETAFKTLKTLLVTSPILAYPDVKKTFILDTDASGFGIGSVLSQVHEDGEHPVCYYSRSLTKCERQYCVTRRELLAVVESVRHFHHYLYGTKILIRTDHGALNWLRHFKNPEGQLARWLEVLDTYDYTIQHRAGKLHGNADGLSRRPCTSCRYCDKRDNNEWETTEHQNRVQSHVQVMTRVKQNSKNGKRNESKQRAKSLQPLVECNLDSSNWMESKSLEEIKEAQINDQVLKQVYVWKEGGTRPVWQDISNLPVEVKAYWAQWDRISLREGILYRKWMDEDTNCVRWQLIVPKCWQKEILQKLHSEEAAGHLGIARTMARIRSRFYWSGYYTHVRRWIIRCTDCQSKRKSRGSHGPMKQYLVGAPMERIALDIIVNLPQTEKGNRHVLVVMDYFTKWAEAFPLPNQESETIADVLISQFISRYGVPKQIHSDQGRQFESKLFKELCQRLQIHKTRTTAYHPQGDGMVERLNRTIEEMLSKVIGKNQRDWEKLLPMVMWAYRSSVHETTGESPAMMMFGRELDLPIDLLYGKPPKDDRKPDNEWIEDLLERMWRVHCSARDKMKKASDRQKKHYDIKASNTSYKVGEPVWFRDNLGLRGTARKLQRNWEGPFTIIQKLSDLVYQIQRGPKSRILTVNVSRLKPFYGQTKRWFVPTEAAVTRSCT